jgi:uncharacterized protein (TIGR02246 family)
MRTTLSGLMVTWACLGVAGVVEAQVLQRTVPAVPPAPVLAQSLTTVPPAGVPTVPVQRPEDRSALRSIAEAYARAYNAGDARALAALFTDDAEMIDDGGEHLRGRPMIEEVFRSTFKERPGATIQIAPASLRFIGPDVAQEEGQTLVKIPGNLAPTTRHYTVMFVKQANRWMYSTVREEHVKGLTHHQRLVDLEWLVGEWIDESPDSVVRTKCRWTEDQNFLIRDFTVHVQGKPVMTVTERIGWDPSTHQIKSWVFDSEGGHGSGLWSRNGDEWVIKSTGILPDGRTATATHILTRINGQSARWSSVERTVGDQVVPDHAEYVMVRRPPQPQAR